jgi:hypothetical protein
MLLSAETDPLALFKIAVRSTGCLSPETEALALNGYASFLSAETDMRASDCKA